VLVIINGKTAKTMIGNPPMENMEHGLSKELFEKVDE
jgi:hypothetical protein